MKELLEKYPVILVEGAEDLEVLGDCLPVCAEDGLEDEVDACDGRLELEDEEEDRLDEEERPDEPEEETAPIIRLPIKCAAE